MLDNSTFSCLIVMKLGRIDCWCLRKHPLVWRHSTLWSCKTLLHVKHCRGAASPPAASGLYFFIYDVIMWRHKGNTTKYCHFRRFQWQKLYKLSRTTHQMKDIYSEILNILKFLIYDVITWRHKGKTTKYRHFWRFK